MLGAGTGQYFSCHPRCHVPATRGRVDDAGVHAMQRMQQLAQVVQGRPGSWCTRRTGCMREQLRKDHNVCAICLEIEQDQASLVRRMLGLGGEPRRRALDNPLGGTQPAPPPDPTPRVTAPLPPEPPPEPAAASPLADMEARLRQPELAYEQRGSYAAAEGLSRGGWGWVGPLAGSEPEGCPGLAAATSLLSPLCAA